MRFNVDMDDMGGRGYFFGVVVMCCRGMRWVLASRWRMWRMWVGEGKLMKLRMRRVRSAVSWLDGGILL